MLLIEISQTKANIDASILSIDLIGSKLFDVRKKKTHM
jgi:hypothetical protein